MSDLFQPHKIETPFEITPNIDHDVSWNDHCGGFEVRVPNGELFYAEHFFDKKVSDRTVEYLQENANFDWRSAKWRELGPNDIEGVEFKNIRWKQDWINFFGKRNPLPRLTSWYGDSGRSYTYSGIKSEPNPWNKGLIYLKQAIEKCAGLEFNSVLLNWYRDGDDSLSWHSDDEKELGINPVIASANFGATREFLIRRKGDNSQKIVVPLKHGTLLLMRGEMQHFWEHSIPKRKNVRESRFNMTFRRIGM